MVKFIYKYFSLKIIFIAGDHEKNILVNTAVHDMSRESNHTRSQVDVHHQQQRKVC